MIYDTLQHRDQYRDLPERILRGLDYLAETDFSALPDGRYEIDGDKLFANVGSYVTKPANDTPEAHGKYMDIQYVFEGKELIGVGPLEEMGEVVACLDPEHTHIPHFYIYSAYDPELAKWRERIQNAQSVQEAEQFRFQAQKVEDKVRAHLTEQLRPWGEAIARNLDTLAHLDLILAKVRLASDWHCCRPEVTDRTELVQLSNPEVAAALAEKGRRFQPIDIHFGRETILVTGANMAGKSVLLKTLALTQYLFQFGFYVPAQRASLCVVEEIITSIGDRQSELSGLSSFAVEILTIDKIIQEGRAGKRVLALVDELARTTNPEEGKVLVGNFIRLTTQLGITALVTTHYGGIEASCRRLRVKGLQLKEGQVVTTGNISDFMDYALVETDADEVPMEAFTIARLFGVDDELLAKPR